MVPGDDRGPETDDDRLIRTLPRRARRALLLGVGIALAGGAVLGVGLGLIVALLSSDSEGGLELGDLVELVPIVLSLVLIGAAAGLLAATMPIGRRIVEVGGRGRAARAVRRHVLRDEPAASEVDHDRAVRWAGLYGAAIPYQTAGFAALYLGILMTQVVPLLGVSPGSSWRWWVSASTSAFIIIAVGATLPVQLRQARRASRYRDAHPA